MQKVLTALGAGRRAVWVLVPWLRTGGEWGVGGRYRQRVSQGSLGLRILSVSEGAGLESGPQPTFLGAPL